MNERVSKAEYEALEGSSSAMEEAIPDGRFLFYGNSGVGKTILSLSLAQRITPPDKHIFYIDTSGGWVSSLNHDPVLRARTTKIRYQGYSQLDSLRKTILAARKSPSDFPEKYVKAGCIILDEFSVMIRRDLYVLTETAAKSDSKKDPDTPVWPDMRKSTHRASKTQTSILEMPDCHTIMTCHQRWDDINGIQAQTMSLMKETREFIKEPLHLVGRVTADEVKRAGTDQPFYTRQVQCHPTAMVDAKSRVGGLRIKEDVASLIEKVDEWMSLGGVLVPESKPITLESEKNLPQSEDTAQLGYEA